MRAVLLVVAGILAAEYCPSSQYILWLFPSASAVLMTSCLCLWNRWHSWGDPILQSALILFVVLLHSLGTQEARSGVLAGRSAGDEITIAGIVDSEPVRKNERLSFVIALDSVLRDRCWHPEERSLLVNFQRTNNRLDSTLAVGQELIASARLMPFPRPRNPGEFDYGRFLLLNGIQGIAHVGKKDSLWPSRNAIRWGWQTVVAYTQRTLFQLFDRLHPATHAAFLKGVVWGFRAEIPEEIKRSFMDTGTIHILAVSGSNVAVVALALSAVLGMLRLRRRILAFAVVAGLVFYMIVTGSSPSVIRATIMALVVIGGTTLERRTEVYNSLAAAALILLCLNTETLFDVGFQLSFSAVLSLVYFYPPLERLVMRIPERFEEIRLLSPALKLFAVSVAAQIGTIPFTAATFGRVSIISVLANLVVVPVSGLNVLIGFAEAACVPLSDSIASAYAAVNDVLVWFLLGFVNAAAAVPYATIAVGGLSTLSVIAYYIGAVSMVQLRRPAVVRALLWMTLVGTNAVVLSTLIVREQKALRLTFLDVGQGDAVLVETPSGGRMLIDAGPATDRTDAGSKVIVPYLIRRGIPDLDAVVITHFHGDHSGGLASILKACRVRRLVTGEGARWERGLDSLIRRFEADGMTIQSVRTGEMIPLDPWMRAYVLAPARRFARERNLNGHSVVLQLRFGGDAAMLQGDLEETGERTIAASYGRFLHSALMKAGHHGSSTSSSEEWLSAVDPGAVAISVGMPNKFGHPTPSTIDRYRRKNLAVRRTDEEGALIFESRGNGWREVEWK